MKDFHDMRNKLIKDAKNTLQKNNESTEDDL